MPPTPAARRPAFGVGLVERSALVVAGILALQLLVSLGGVAIIQRETLREDHARRVAELLVVSARTHQLARTTGGDAGATMTTSYLKARIDPARPAVQPAGADADAIRGAIVRWEPQLGRSDLTLWTRSDPAGGTALHGVMRLDDGQWLSFQSTAQERFWPAGGHIALLAALSAALCLAGSFLILRHLGRPLRRLTDAASRLGRQPHGPVAIEGPAELRQLSAVFNEMQDRISGLLEDQRSIMQAISHDMRTPLTRLQLAAEFVEPDDARDMLVTNITELNDLLKSLNAYLQAAHQHSEVEATDLPRLIQEVLQRWGRTARYRGPKTLTVQAHRTALREALVSLVENAVRHGGGAEVELVATGRGPVRIDVRDHGPGMAPEDLAHVFEPFFRADKARARNTAGFGLGVPTAARLLRRFGGDLAIVNAADGGLLVSIQPPLAHTS
ncbi:MAG: HAMP domain-containing protein [Alphaproteobacteria bacterium]|nr:HAMP domain-containing protein [Alphaproteobacteria bacterium]MBU1512703.1 HAMP domain-containing protein [Alphaproteobacteria bacterium]MBU2096082.1 HAMP domain-containing protein [Alphaproteobacteria bacterium]MBU2152438.1 HAMP domain-containing protein [Alphaproteobacteria bacterium]MBU2308028.1 HAMP domain-containing protein [Alphaproteobacteria bacterium]